PHLHTLSLHDALPISYPHRTVFTIPAIFVSAQCFSLQSTSVDLVPTVGNVGKKFVVRASKHLRAVDRVIRAKPLADLEIAHVTRSEEHTSELQSLRHL